MKTDPLSDLLRHALTVPLLSLAASANGQGGRTGLVLPRSLHADGIDAARVLEMRARIEAGRYAPDPDEVAAGVLEAIAPTRRH